MRDLFEILSGKDVGARCSAPDTEAVIGRDPGCDIALNDPQVSRRHARVWPWEDGFAIEDLGSTGGTSVNGVLLTQATALAPGDVVRLGKTELRVLAPSAPAETAAAPIVPDVSGPTPAPASPPPDRRRLVAIPLTLFVGISLAVFLIARAKPLERETAGGAGTAYVAAGDAARGQAAFSQTCAGCHGANAEGGVGPALAGNAITVDQAVGVIRQGRGVMPAGLVSGQTEADVAAYLGTILGSSPIPPAPVAPPVSPPVAPPAPATPPPASPPAATADATRGATVFANTCSGCHGAQAQGGVGPPLAGNPIGVAGATTVIRQGRGGMPAGLVSGQDEADLLAFLATVLAP